MSYEGDLHSMIREYLDHMGFVDAKMSFEEECSKARKPIDDDNINIGSKDDKAAKVQSEMFKYFDLGMRQEFFQTWDHCISADILEGDSWCQKLEFYLNLYFAVHPLKTDKNLEESENSMSQFRNYLETKGSPLSQTPDFLPYYALPFVPNPKSHNSFKELFEINWSSDLRIKLETFLCEVLRETSSLSSLPRLIELYKDNKSLMKGKRDNLKVCEKKLSHMEKKSVTQSKQVLKFQDDYQKLMGVTAELITALEAAVKGDWVDIDQVLSKCSAKFPEIFQTGNENRSEISREFQNGSPSSNLGMQKFKETLQKQSEKVSLMTSLEYEKIKKDLVGADLRTKLLLTQALRWRITRKCDREEVILASYISNDLLGCEKSSDYKQKIINNIRSPSEALRQSFARFLNVFASFCSGRSYLAQHPQLLSALIENVKSEDVDQVTLDMTLGTLQKLSLRRKLQTLMIEDNLVDCLVTLLEEHLSLSEYSLEYASALFMNLCLRTAGKNSCIKYPRRILSLLIALLDIGQKYTSIITYVNGALYSILSVSAIRSDAIKFGLSKVLEVYMKQSNSDMRRQYEYILKQLNNNSSKVIESGSEVEDDDDEEDEVDLDPELDKNDLVSHREGELCGEQLLATKYVSKTNEVKETFELKKVNSNIRPKPDVKKAPSPQSLNNTRESRNSFNSSIQNVDERLRNRSKLSDSKERDESAITILSAVSSKPSLTKDAETAFESENFQSNYAFDNHNYSSLNNQLDLVESMSSIENFYDEAPGLKNPSRRARVSTADSSSSDNQFNTSILTSSFRKSVDKQATDLVNKATGRKSEIVEAVKNISPSNHFPGLSSQEYTAAFSTRPRIPRTPDSDASPRRQP